jgi:CBS-domain-containing membrane protein
MIPKSLVEYISDKSTVRQALEKMSFHRYTAIPVLSSDGEYVGTLRNDDILDFFLSQGSFDRVMAEDVCVTEIMVHAPQKPLLHSATLGELIECVKEHNFVPIIDDRGCFIGIVLRREVLNYLLKLLNQK